MVLEAAQTKLRNRLHYCCHGLGHLLSYLASVKNFETHNYRAANKLGEIIIISLIALSEED